MNEMQDYPMEVNRWEVYEITLEGPSSGNPFIEQRLQGIFTGKNESVVTEGFYDGSGKYKIRFMPSFSGRYSFILKGSFLETTLSGRFVVNEAQEGNHGPVRTANTYHFAYEDGTSFNPAGTVCNGWHVQYDGDITASLNAFKSSGFNKVRFAIFPYHNAYNLDDPQYFPYEGTPMSTHLLTPENVEEYTGANPENHFDLSRFNTACFAHLETLIQQLGEEGIEAELVLFHPYDRWGFSCMSDKENDLYLSYVTNRFACYHNVWWSLADGWDLDKHKTLKDWEHYADLLVRKDPYRHLRSIQNDREIYDATRPWLTHASVRMDDLYRCAELTDSFRVRFHKPVIMDDLGSEGNTPVGWDSLSPEEMTRRFWETAMRGGYPEHREMYLEDPHHVWSQHGSILRGESWERAVFLKKILDEVPGSGLAPVCDEQDCVAAVPEMEYSEAVKSQYLYYFSFLRPSYRDFNIDDTTDYVVEIIDTYAMTIKRYGIYHGAFQVILPCKPYLAIRLRRAELDDYNYVEPAPVKEEEPEQVFPTFTEETDEEKEEKTAVHEEVNSLTETIKLPVEETKEEEPVQQPEEEPKEEEKPVETVEASAETVQLPLKKEDFDEDDDIFDELANNHTNETAEEAIEETLEEPVFNIKDELLEGADDDNDLDLSDIPEFIEAEKQTTEETVKQENTAPVETPAEEDIPEDEDDELPEIVEDSYLAMQNQNSGNKNKDTLNIPPINFGDKK